MNAKYLIIERKVIKMVATMTATTMKIRGVFYFTQPDNVVMFDETLSQTAKVVYCNLLSHVKKGTNRCKLYISTIAEEVKRSVRTVRRALSQLCERGIIVRFMQYGNKQNQLASLFVIIGKNAACYQDSSHQSVQSVVEQTNQANQVEVNTEKVGTVNDAIVEADTLKASADQVLPSGTKMASPCEIKAATKVRTESETRSEIRSETKTKSKAETRTETKTASLPKVSAPHAKNGRQNNNKGDNKNLLKDTLIGQAELPKLSSFSSSSSSSSLKKNPKDDHKTAQILIDFDAQEEQELHETQETKNTQKTQEISDQKKRLADFPVTERPNESDESNENKADEHSNSEILSEIGDKIDDTEAVVETAIDSVIEPESESEDLPLPEEVECSDVDSVNSIGSNSAFDPLACVQNADKIPNDMLDTARYFLYRTGRDPRSINEKEIQAMREVFAKHYPARIQKEIDVACRRFFKNGKSLKVLFFGYIAAALRKQQSLVPFDRIAQKTFSKTAEKLAKQEEDGNIKASSGQETPQLREVSGGHRYLTSEDISDKTNPLSSMSMEELLALEKELDGKMKKS